MCLSVCVSPAPNPQLGFLTTMLRFGVVIGQPAHAYTSQTTYADLYLPEHQEKVLQRERARLTNPNLRTLSQRFACVCMCVERKGWRGGQDQSCVCARENLCMCVCVCGWVGGCARLVPQPPRQRVTLPPTRAFPVPYPAAGPPLLSAGLWSCSTRAHGRVCGTSSSLTSCRDMVRAASFLCA
ncbi:MAG: hypothetical protein P4L40_05370 [Terracidiphilus sp.]|nr:hypothetical protein [Terracidiphilus sp.]